MESSVSLEDWASAYIAAYSSDNDLSPDDPLWWAFERSLLVLRRDASEEIWQFVLTVLAKGPPQSVLGNLSAGPLEDLIAYEGSRFIDRIEQLARRDPAFRHLLGGVWQNRTPPDIWRRVELARGASW